uniref:Uncharacterized protein n=1 Tax=Rhizophora mucronata TaxID=61149 RepID=A0A2P2KBA3_RHIMU
MLLRRVTSVALCPV